MVIFAATTASAATATDTQTFDDLGWTDSYEKAGSTKCPLPDGWYMMYDNDLATPDANTSKPRSGKYCVAQIGQWPQNSGYTATLIFPAKAGTVSAWALAYGYSQYVSVTFYKMTQTGTGTFSYGTELASYTYSNGDITSTYKELSATLDEDGYVGLKFCCVYIDDISNTYEVAPTTHAVSGTVKDANGAALSGATVTLTPGSYSATTDADGAFALADVPEGDYTATASLAGYTSASTSVSVAADVTGVALTLSPVVTTVSGIITKYNSDNSTSPLANATVVLRERTSQAEVASTVSGADGSFSISITGAIAADGKYQLVPTHAYYKFDYVYRNVTLTEGQTTSDVSITLDPIKLKYVFTVTDAATAEPINDATVTVSADGAAATAATYTYNGTYTYSGEAEWIAGITSFSATIAREGYKTQTRTFTFDDEPASISLTKYNATVFSGEVSDSDAEILVPLANVSLYAYNEDAEEPYTLVGTTVTDEEGAFTLSLDGEVVSTYKLTVTCEHYRDFELTIENVEREGSYYRICDLTPIYYTYTFDITDAQTGEAVPNTDAEVTVTAPDGHFTTVVNVGAGSWSLIEAEYDLCDEEYVLHVSIPGYQHLDYNFTIAGEEGSEELSLDPVLYTFTATVVDIDTEVAIDDAVITIGDEVLLPDAEGLYTFTVRALDYDGSEFTATASAEKYEDVSYAFTFSDEQPAVSYDFNLKRVTGVSDISADGNGVMLRGGSLYISGDARVYDTMGRLVRNVRAASGEAVNLRPGVYIVNGTKVRIY